MNIHAPCGKGRRRALRTCKHSDSVIPEGRMERQAERHTLEEAATKPGEIQSPDREEPYEQTDLLRSGVLQPKETFRKPWQQARIKVKEQLMGVRGLLRALAGFEWYCLAALGILTAFMSFFLDLSVSKLLRAQHWLYRQLHSYPLLQFLCWILYPVSMCAVSTAFSHTLSPYTAGSGVPEVRTILSGLEMADYLTLSNLFGKMVGLTCTLAASSVVFLGKVGPMVHLCTMVGAFLYRLYVSVAGEEEPVVQRKLLVASSAVAVASTFGAPVSGVLFSVEVMSVHFALRDYCQCFFAAAIGALTFRLLAVWSSEQETIQPLFKTSFSSDLPYHPAEILVFALLGLLCGTICCVFLSCHRWIIHFVKTNTFAIRMLSTEKVLYSALVALVLACVTFPGGVGHLMAAELTMKQLLSSLLDSQQWWSLSHNATGEAGKELSAELLWHKWSPSGISIFYTLGCFLILKMFLLVLATTLPLPAGYFMPVFIYGAGVGRLLGEGLAYWFPTGLGADGINPGGYALAGAAAFSGAVTHTLSPAILTIELTGQHVHAAPTLIAVLIANALARSQHRPSFYDAISLIKKLPHLPSLLLVQPQLSLVQLGQVWHAVEETPEPQNQSKKISNVLLCTGEVVLEKRCRVQDVCKAVSISSQADFAVVHSHKSMTLLGCVSRVELLKFLKHHPADMGLDKCLADMIKPVPLLLSTKTTVQQAHQIMHLLSMPRLFVAHEGRLIGSITLLQLKKMIECLAKNEVSSCGSHEQKHTSGP